jgi:hypothetical protein
VRAALRWQRRAALELSEAPADAPADPARAAGPTRRAIREAYSLPVAPEEMKAAGECADCLTHTVPCVAVFAGCQDARELEARGVSDAAPIKPAEFSWKPTPLAMAR